MDFGLDKIKGFSASTILGFLGGTIIPGFLFIFVYSRGLFMTMDKFLLCLIAPATTLPLLVVNSGLILVGMMKDQSTLDETTFHRSFAATIYFGNILTALIIYLSILIGYFFELTMKMGVLTVLITETVTVIVLIILMKPFNDIDEKKKK